MVASISPDPRLQFFANDGSPLVGGKLYTYAAGTTTPLATYTTSTGLIANTNPIILDSRGEASVWFGASKYKFVLKTAADVEIWTQDQLGASVTADGANAYGTWPINISGNAATATTLVGGAVTSINGAGLYGFTLTGGPITSTGTLTVTPPVPSTAGNYMVSNGTSWVSQAFAGGSQFQDQLFTASGTWTAPTGVTKVRATVIAGGSGSFNNGTLSQYGAGGGCAVGTYTVTPGTTYTVTVGTGGVGATTGTSGAGGASSFGSLISATGGSGATSTIAGVGGAGSSGNLVNSISSGFYSLSTAIPYFRIGGGVTLPLWTTDTLTAPGKVWDVTYSNNLIQAGNGAKSDSASGIGVGGVGGIVYLEWVG